MNNKKLTDKEIVKALEDCVNHNDSCSSCPSNEFCYKHDSKLIMKATLDLINRLQAENERLRQAMQKNSVGLDELKQDIAHDIKLAKAEAYKEFAELVQGEIDDALHSNYNAKAERMSKPKVDMADEFISYCEGKIHALSGLNSYIDNLLKELVGEDSD